MNIHTQCLNLLILLATFNPVVLSQLFLNGKDAYSSSLERSFKTFFIVYTLILSCIFIISPENFYMNIHSNYYWYIISILAVPLTIILEILIGYIILSISKKKFQKFCVSPAFKKININIILLSIFIGAFEEIVYRQLWFNIMFKDFNLNIIFVLIITSFVYGLNHIFLGKQVFFEKILAGVIYGCLFYFSGFNIIIPLIAHCLENAVILLKG